MKDGKDKKSQQKEGTQGTFDFSFIYALMS